MRFLPIVVLASAAATFSGFLVPVAVQAQTAGFADVPGSHWAAQSVAALAQKGIISGQSSAPLGGAASAKGKGGPAYDGNKPVTRYELAVTLYRFVQYVEHADKMKKTKFGAEAVPISGPEALKILIAEGYLPKSTPLAKETGKPVTANQLADAMAQVLIKSRDKTTPLSPDLRNEKIEKPAALGQHDS